MTRDGGTDGGSGCRRLVNLHTGEPKNMAPRKTAKAKTATTRRRKTPPKAKPADRDEAGRFLPGNKFWKARSSAGIKPKFETPEALEAACMEYFDWVHENPIMTVELVKHAGNAKQVQVPKMRAMTIGSLCLFIDVTQRNWIKWREDRPDLSPVMTRVEEIIRAQKFEGAAADLLNPNIIARDLGLADKKEHSGELNVRTLSDFYAGSYGATDT